MRAEDVLRAVDNGVYSLLPAWRPAVNRLFRADGAKDDMLRRLDTYPVLDVCERMRF